MYSGLLSSGKPSKKLILKIYLFFEIVIKDVVVDKTALNTCKFFQTYNDKDSDEDNQEESSEDSYEAADLK